MNECKHKTKVLRRNAGFSLIEIMIVVFLVAIVLYTVSYAFLTSARTSVSLDRRSDVTASLQNSVDRIVDELRVSEDVLSASSDSASVLIGGEDVTFNYDAGTREITRNGAVIATNVSSVTFTYLDADGNETGNVANIRRVLVTVQGQRGDELLELESSVNLRKRQ
ncbi:prepilin-type N-terminal cleavage/methylation domain-containing protein [bacterium]|nr:prepilin-type N-terminal cleavage/methylation domain-containing protein [bacterium]